MVGAMHFMDGYNFDLERVERCGIHYADSRWQDHTVLHDEYAT